MIPAFWHSGIFIAVFSLIFLRPVLTAFGGRGQTLEYAIEYTRILAFGFPMAILGTGASQLIRADGSPKYAMISTMSGAALATVIGQFVSAALIVTCISVTAFLCFQILPRQIISLFGKGDALYFEFALRYFHIFLFCTFIVGAQILCAQFFPSIGKGSIGTVVSLSRQVFFLLPLIIVFPLIWGIDGVLWSGPIADGLSGILALLLVRREMKKWK